MNFRLPLAIATAILFAAAMSAASEPVLQCTTNGGGWTVTATAPFDALPCPAEKCTGMTYNITPHRGETPDHVAITVDWEPQIIIPPSNFDTPPCAGDNVSGLAARDCANQTSRINQNQQKTGPFDLVVVGTLAPIHGSIVVKKGKVLEQCRIATLGTEAFDPHAQVTLTETLEFKGCSLTIPTDPMTGKGLPATIAGAGCKIVANGEPPEAMTVEINGQSIGDGTWFKDGSAFSNGDESCTNRIVGGRLYTMCDCKSLSDPKPPCL
jgi:hypothetical protein